jgi:YgiT-type zinc finger domain-containing protein
MRPSTATYFTWLGDALITVPDFPCWVCDICGRREYDPKALSALNLLLSPNAGSPTPRYPRTSKKGTSTTHKAGRPTPPE